MKNWNEELYLYIPWLSNASVRFNSRLELNRTLHELNRYEKPLRSSKIVEIFGLSSDTISDDFVVLPDGRYYLNVFEEWSEEEHEFLPSLVVCYSKALEP